VGVTEAAPEVSFARMMERQQAVADVVRADPDVASVVSFIGADGTNASANTGRLSITLKPRASRDADVEAIIARLQPRLHAVEGVAVYPPGRAGPSGRHPHGAHAVPVHPRRR
jgi:multidrug efflux pump